MSKSIETVYPDTSLEELADIFRESQISGAPVVDPKGKILGVISKTNLLNAFIEERDPLEYYPEFYHLSEVSSKGNDGFDVYSQLSGAVKDYMNKEIVTVHATQHIGEVAQLMMEKKVHRAIVIDHDKVVGMISAFDVLKCYPLITNLENIGQEPVQSIMKKKVITIDMDEKLSDAICRMEEYGIRQLPVLEKGKLVGIITDRDLRKAQGSQVIEPEAADDNDYWMDTILVGEIMAKDPKTLTHQSTIKEAAYQLKQNKIGSLPVMQNDEMVGIVTQSDVLDYLIHK